MIGFMAVLAGCGSSKERLIILQTGRMAGNVYPLEVRGVAPLQHYPYLAGYVKQVREEARREGAEVLLIDSGDSLLGSFASYATGAQNMVTLFNTLGYDALFLGNLDANLEEAMVEKIQAPLLIPFVRESGEPALAGARLALKLRKGPTELVLLPNFYGNFDPAEAPQRFPIWFGTATGKVKPLRNYGPVLAGLQPINEKTLTLFHWMKFESGGLEPSSYVEQLKGMGVTLILAHSIYSSSERDTWKQRDYSGWGLPISENILRQNRGFTVARVDLLKGKKGWEVERPARIIPMNANTAPADPILVDAIKPFAKQIQQADVVLGELSESVDEEALLQSHLLTLTGVPGANMVFYSAASVRGSLDKGKLTASKLYNAIPWTGELSLIELRPEQLAALRQMKGYALLSKKGSESKPVLVSSRYFTRLLQDSLKLTEDQIRPAGVNNEFEFAKQAYQSGRSLPVSKPQLGDWIYESLD
ncbi:MAG: hypothetical protein HC904_15705 [Blastochloris sp.]|nr:hypothetical protein [Blastochloris sp.]